MSTPPTPPQPTPETPQQGPTFEMGTHLVCDEENGEVDRTSRPTDLQWVRALREEERRAQAAAEGASSPAPARTAEIARETGETKIRLAVNLDGTGKGDIATGVGFFDHMLTLLTRHSLIDLTVHAEGDLHVDAHHTVEDVGICYGKALARALGDKASIRRYGSATVPMDETLATAAVDLSGRSFCVWKADVPLEILGTFNAPLAEEFWRAVSSSGAFALHVVLHHGRNTHHIVEGIFKACARALRQAVEPDPRVQGVPSTKGVL
jgi:imidazoleglycerol-phosphate dehydratase